MKIGILGDIHLDRNKRFDATIEIAHRALREMRGAEVDLIVQVGDLFEGRTTPAERAAGDELVMAASQIAESIWIRGNHDDAGDCRALGNLRGRCAIWTVSHVAGIIATACGVQVACVPHLTGQAGREDLPVALGDFGAAFGSYAGPHLLAGHFSLMGAALSNGETLAHQGMSLSAGDLLALGAQVVVAGHIHLPQSMCDGRAWHTGSIVRHDFGERDDEKGWLLIEYDVTTGPRVTFRPLPQPAMIKIEAMLTEDGWCDVADHRPLPGTFEWPACPPDAEIWVLLHYPSHRAAEYRTMRDEAERRYPSARIDHRAIPTTERRSVEFTSAKGLEASFVAWRRSEGDYHPLAVGVAAKLAEVEAAVPGFGTLADGPSAMAAEGLVLGDLDFVGINGVTEPIRVPYSEMHGIICFAGPNGSAKTTTFEASLAGLTREMAYYGSSLPARCAGVAHIAQSFSMAGMAYQSFIRVSPKGAMEAVLCRNDSDLNDPKLLRQFDEQIRAVVGSKETLELTVFARQAGPDGKAGFFDLAPADRTARIVELTGCQRYETAAKYASERRKALDLPIREAQATIDTLERQLTVLPGLQVDILAREIASVDQGIVLAEADEAVTAAMRAEAEIAAAPEGADALRRQLADLTARREELRAAYATLTADLRIQEQTASQRAAVEQAVQEVQNLSAELGVARTTLAALEEDFDRHRTRAQEASDLAAQIAGLERAHADLMAAATLERERSLSGLREEILSAETAYALARAAVIDAAHDPDVQQAEGAVLMAKLAAESAMGQRRAAIERASLAERVPCAAQAALQTTCELLAGARSDRDALLDLDDRVIAADEAVALAEQAVAGAAARAGQRFMAAGEAVTRAEQDLVARREALAAAEATPAEIPAEAMSLGSDIELRRQRWETLRPDNTILLTVPSIINRARQDIASADTRLTTAREQAALLPLVEAAERRVTDLTAQRASGWADGTRVKAQCDDIETRLVGLAEQEGRLIAARDAVAAAKARRQEAEARHAQALASVATTRGQIEQLEALRPQADEANVTLTALARDQAEWALVEKGCGKTGLQALAIDEAGPEIADLVNQLLLECHGPRWTFGVATQAEKADGKGVKNRFAPLIFDWGELRDRVSGGEGAILDVAVRLALAVFNGRHSGRRYQVIWLDEAAQAVGKEDSATYVHMLRLAMQIGGFVQILIISHDERVQALCDWIVRLKERAIESIECQAGRGMMREAQHA